MEHGEAHPVGDAKLKAALYVVGTPIGNLRDITLRALDTLRGADVIAAEDTRLTSGLLAHYGIRTRLMAAHEHNERRAGAAIAEIIAAGKAVALVTDAGTPAVSDPGARVVAAVREAGHEVVAVPGANAAIAAVSVGGMEAPHFLFYGFLPSRAAERRRELGALVRLPYAIVFYESPHRVRESVGDLCDVLGGSRRIVIARELTKRFETVRCCRLDEACAWFDADDNRLRGEFVLQVEGAPASSDSTDADVERVLTALLEDLPVKQAATIAAKITGRTKKSLYDRALDLGGRR